MSNEFTIISLSTNLFPLLGSRDYNELKVTLTLLHLFHIQLGLAPRISNYFQVALDTVNGNWLLIGFLWFRLHLRYQVPKGWHILYEWWDSRNPNRL